MSASPMPSAFANRARPQVDGWLDSFWSPDAARAKAEAAEAAAKRGKAMAAGAADLARAASPVRKARMRGPTYWTRTSPASAAVLVKEEAIVDRLLNEPPASVSVEEVVDANGGLLEVVREQGLRKLIDAVREHHDPTYQHCMLVNTVSAAFSTHLGFSRSDCSRMMLSAAMHDVGKSRIPVEILDLPRKLEPHEFEIVKLHPVHAEEMLAGSSGLDSAVMDGVVHHHEYLDGTGYPHSLSGSAVNDMPRLLTICDIFSALMERRTYKPPMEAMKAFAILEGMGGKLDQPLVRAFRPIAEACA